MQGAGLPSANGAGLKTPSDKPCEDGCTIGFKTASLRTFVAFAIVANSHHPGQFEKHWQILAGISL